MDAKRRTPVKSRKSPLKSRNINLKNQLAKKQIKRKSLLFADFESEPPAKKPSIDESLNDDSFSLNGSFLNTSKQTSPVKTIVATLPTDLRLASKIRIISNHPFVFTGSSESSSSNAVVFEKNSLDDACNVFYRANVEEPDDKTLKNVHPANILRAAGLYYQCPDVSFMQMFPRLDGVARSKGVRTSLQSLGYMYTEALFRDWAEALDQLYNSWLNGTRSCFYCCAPQFTAFFVKVKRPERSFFDPDETRLGFDDFNEHKIIITPTSSGFRSLLKREEIQFTLPVNARRLSKGDESFSQSMSESMCSTSMEASLLSVSSSQLRGNRTPEKENANPLFERPTGFHDDFISPLKMGEDVEQEEFLRKIGHSPSILRFSQSQSQQMDDGAVEDVNLQLASSAGTTVVISDSFAIEAFRNLLVTHKLGWAKSGPQSGLPPTLLSTQAFINGSLKTLEFNTQVLVKPDATLYTLDIENGPILPHVPKMLHEFLRSSGDQLSPGNNLKFHVNGRSIYNGLNEGTSETFRNLTDYSYDGRKERYVY